MVLSALERGIDVVAYNRTTSKVEEIVGEISTIKNQISKTNIKNKNIGDFIPTYSTEELIKNLQAPRVIILMVPQGEAVKEMIAKLVGIEIPEVSIGNHLRGVLERGDTIIDGGNCFYRDSQRNYNNLKQKGINYIDMGTSGGLEGARNGACLMIGGDEEVFIKLESLFAAMATKDGYAYFGPSGAGHFVKMVHNGVEYGMLQALGEGFEILEKGPFKLDFRKIAKNWSNGSVVRGWLTELLERAFAADPKLERIEGVVGGGTTGRWTEQVAKEETVETPVISASLKAREESKIKPTFAGKIVAALRNQFGGHETKKAS